MQKSYGYILLFLLLLIIDQFTKYLFYDLSYASQLLFMEPILNTGISYGISIDYFLIITVSVVVLFFMLRWSYKGYVSYFVATLFLAGLMGNLIDRLYLNGVRDFFVFFDWFICNIADIYLTLAIVFLVWEDGKYVQKMSGIFSGKNTG